MLESEVVEIISDILGESPVQELYATLKNRLISEFANSEECIMKKLLEESELGDERPSILLREMRELAENKLSDQFLSMIFPQRLPTNVRATLISINEKDVSKLTTVPDKIIKIAPAKTDNNIYATTSIDSSKKINQLEEQIQQLTEQI